MTYRQRFDRRMRLGRRVLYGAVLLAVGLVVVGRRLDASEVLGTLVVFPLLAATFAFAVVAQHRAFRCPGCRAGLGTYLAGSGGWGIGTFRYCPHCAFDLDHEIAPADAVIRQP
jgi:hypothetical protein